MKTKKKHYQQSVKKFYRIALPVLFLFSIKLAFAQNNNSIILLLTGKYEPEKSADAIKIENRYAIKENIYLNKEAYLHFTAMAEAAKKDEIDLYILSGIRTFDQQKTIWENKFNGNTFVNKTNLKKKVLDELERSKIILNYSSMPGTSRHHWGTDIDISFSRQGLSAMLDNKTYSTGKGLKVYNWLKENAATYGFCQPYKETPARRNQKYANGYLEEKWHWSYKPLAKKYLLEYEKYIEKLKPGNFTGSTAIQNIYSAYILNIHKECL